MTYKFTLKASKTRHQHCPTQFNLPSITKHIVSDREHFWALQDGFQLFKKMLFQSFQSGYNSSSSNDQKLQVICFANNPIPFIVTHWAWYSSLLRYWTWCGKKAKGVIKVYVKSCNGGGKKNTFFFFFQNRILQSLLCFTLSSLITLGLHRFSFTENLCFLHRSGNNANKLAVYAYTKLELRSRLERHKI